VTHTSEAGLVRSVVTYGSGGRTMLFQHGLCGDGAQTTGVFPQDIGWRGMTLECRGHGGSEAGPFGELSIVAFANDVIALIERRRIAPLPLGGISMGAAIALRIAVTRPDLVSALVVARPAWLDRAAPANMRPNAEVAALLRDHAPEEARRLFDETALAKRLAVTSPDNLASLRGFFSREPIEVTRELLSRISADGPEIDRGQIAAIRVPTLVIGNDFDAVHPMAIASETAQLIPGARLVKIPSKSEDRDAYRTGFQTALAGFLKDLP
jgi:pimeloyl-ACP methyl ester carboxylesterase